MQRMRAQEPGMQAMPAAQKPEQGCCSVKSMVWLPAQVDLHIPELTVRETFDFAARVQGSGIKAGKSSQPNLLPPCGTCMHCPSKAAHLLLLAVSLLLPCMHGMLLHAWNTLDSPAWYGE